MASPRPHLLSATCLGVTAHGQGPDCTKKVALEGNPLRLCAQHRNDPASIKNSKLIRSNKPGLSSLRARNAVVVAAFGTDELAKSLPVSVADARAVLAHPKYNGAQVSVENNQLVISWVDGPIRAEMVSAVLSANGRGPALNQDLGDTIVTRRVPSGKFYARALMVAGLDRGLHIPQDRGQQDVFDRHTLAGALASVTTNRPESIETRAAAELLEDAGVDPDKALTADGRARLAAAYHRRGRAEALAADLRSTADLLDQDDDTVDLEELEDLFADA